MMNGGNIIALQQFWGMRAFSRQWPMRTLRLTTAERRRSESTKRRSDVINFPPECPHSVHTQEILKPLQTLTLSISTCFYF